MKSAEGVLLDPAAAEDVLVQEDGLLGSRCRRRCSSTPQRQMVYLYRKMGSPAADVEGAEGVAPQPSSSRCT